MFTDFNEIKRISVLYPYCKFRKFRNEEDAWKFVRQHVNKHALGNLYNYGDAFSLHVKMEYFIGKDSIYYNFRTEKMGYIKIVTNKAVVENKSNLIMVELKDISLNNMLIVSHLIAIYHGLQLLGDFVDVDITVPDHSIFYTLMTYSGTNKTINKILDKIKSRLGKLSVTLLNVEEDEESDE